MKKFILLSLFALLPFAASISTSQVNTPPLSPEETEVVKPFQSLVNGWYKQDLELYMSAYHEKAEIETTTRRKISKDTLRKVVKLEGNISCIIEIEKIQIKGNIANVNCTVKTGDQVVPMIYNLIKETDGHWFIIRRQIRQN